MNSTTNTVTIDNNIIISHIIILPIRIIINIIITATVVIMIMITINTERLILHDKYYNNVKTLALDTTLRYDPVAAII